MAKYDDEDDWVGTPPEGHYTADRADPEFWRQQRAPLRVAVAGIAVLLVVLVIVIVLS